MIIDSSTLLAIILGENDAKLMAEAIAGAGACKLSAANWLETAMVVDGRGLPEASIQFEALLRELLIEIVPVDARIASLARAAHRQFGRGNHPARLNSAIACPTRSRRREASHCYLKATISRGPTSRRRCGPSYA